jgi:hypothetical protein
MYEAADSDSKNVSEGKPGIAKLSNLEQVEQFLRIRRYHETFLSMNGCVVLQKWLQRHSDGTFPCSLVVESILRAIADMPIAIENL